jgi:transcriptional regulator with XRE-family HTH domain
MAGFEYKHYQKIEAGRRPNLRLDTLERLAQAFGLEASQLLSQGLPEDTRLVPVSKGPRSEKRRRRVKKPAAPSV